MIGPPTTTLLTTPGRHDVRAQRDVHVRGQPAERDVRLLDRRARLRARASSGVTYAAPGRRRARVHDPGDQRVRHGRGARGHPRVDDRRRDAARRRRSSSAPAPITPARPRRSASRPTRPTRRFECALDTAPGAEPAWNQCAQPPENTAEFTDLAGRPALAARARGRPERQRRRVAGRPTSWTITPAGAAEHAGRHGRDRDRDEPGGATTAATFGTVTTAGYTLVTELAGSSPLPLGYLPAGARFFDVEHDRGRHSGALSVCLTYDPGSLPEPVRLLHFDGSVWVDVTTTNDPAAGRICGEPGQPVGASRSRPRPPAVVPDTSILSGPPAETVLPERGVRVRVQRRRPSRTSARSTRRRAFSSCEATHLFEGLLEGEHELLVRAVNELGTFDATPARHRWTIVPLDTFIDSGPDEATEETSATFEFSSNHPGDVTFECLLDEALAYEPCDVADHVQRPDRRRALAARARQGPGRQRRPDAGRVEWAIGEVPDPVTITSGPDARTESRGPPRSSGRAPTPTRCSSARSTAPTSRSAARRRPTAACSTRSTRSRSRSTTPTRSSTRCRPRYTWTVADDAPPTTTITFGPPAVTGNDFANFTLTSNEPLATFECSLDGARVRAVRRRRSATAAWRSATTRSRRAPSTPRATATGRRRATSGASWPVRRPRSTLGPDSETTSTTATFDVLVRPGRLDASSARSTAARSWTARRRTSTPGSPTATTCSASARATRRASSTTRRRSTTGWSTCCPRRRSSPGRRRSTSETSASFTLSANETERDVRVLARRRPVRRVRAARQPRRGRSARCRTASTPPGSARSTAPATSSRSRRATPGRSTRTAPDTTITDVARRDHVHASRAPTR